MDQFNLTTSNFVLLGTYFMMDHPLCWPAWTYSLKKTGPVGKYPWLAKLWVTKTAVPYASTFENVVTRKSKVTYVAYTYILYYIYTGLC